MKYRIFLDLDGVMRDWDAGIWKLFHIEDPWGDEPRGWNDIQDFICESCEIDKGQFWAAQDYDFWRSLPYTKEALGVAEAVRDAALSGEVERVVLLTSPSMDSAGGTQAWIRKNLPDFFRAKQYLIGPAKDACANPTALLIDDSDANCSKFRLAGGDTILFPRPWNELHFVTDRVGYLRYELDRRGLL